MAKRLTEAAVERIATGRTRREIPDASCRGLCLVGQRSGKKWRVVRRMRRGQVPSVIRQEGDADRTLAVDEVAEGSGDQDPFKTVGHPELP